MLMGERALLKEMNELVRSMHYALTMIIMTQNNKHPSRVAGSFKDTTSRRLRQVFQGWDAQHAPL